ncbi:DUF1561 family protein, partial [Helicobacter sp. 13S00477-4]|uniref:DUF1561 family protein n=1 Tax=Helicobacter sp. 13S00477-4 TaxID=1905759 RepID=UPI001179E4D0
QKLTDKPIDKSIHIKTHDKGNYCYAPVFTKGEAYIYIDDCSSSYVQSARYDVFQRIAYKINNNWLCLTAPSSVTGIDGESTQQWDYVLLRPCAINDANQRWVIKNNAIWTADEKYRIKDYQWYAFISKKSDDYYDHTLDSSMQAWSNTIATPGNISFKTPLSWTFIDPTQWGVYYIQNNKSTLDEVINLYYNPENGHIAQFYPSDGSLYCMTSNHNSKDNWDWVSWNVCSDDIPKNKDNKYWDTSFLIENKGAIRDYQGNILRITKYGTNWGVPYTAKPSYLQKDTSNTPDSLFLFSHDIEKWNRYVDGNLGETLHYCPAPGHKLAQNNGRIKRSLPPDFKLNEEWRKRLYAIATSTDTSKETSGICGSCLLQSFQMIAELQEYYSSTPLQSGGYFFDTAPNTNPFISFRQRFP